ncbi:FecR domain-containing protein [Caulobacter sp. NIBR2454]|uniref:FecR domain-containing protein n=1 Tax=Caulobacter sp. NIBR2454 TaxID=3015996 RepID=UPI0022B67932|nr:FecR domain-containing protein [Caulobacter sp. NIBR2454]
MKAPALALAALLAFAAPAVAAPAPQAPETPIAYVVRQGDNLYTLAQRYLIRLNDHKRVRTASGVRNVRALRVGSTLKIDPQLLRFEPIEARLVAVSGAVTLQDARGSTPAVRDALILEGHRLITGANSFATFQLADGSRVTLPSNSRMRIVQLRRLLLDGSLQRLFELEAGRGGVSATPAENANSQFRVRTPLSVTAVRGTEFRVVHAEADNRSATEVIEGLVGVGATQTTVAETPVKATFGVTAGAQGVGEPMALLPAPDLAPGGAVQEEPQLKFAAKPAEGAVSYRFQLANDAGFVDLFAEGDSGDGQATFPSVRDGTYFVRLTAVDRNGLEGLPSVYSFDRTLNVLEPGAPPQPEGEAKMRRFLFRWNASGEGVRTYRFQLSADPQMTTLTVDQPGLTQPQATITNLAAGAWYWRVVSVRYKDGAFTQKLGPIQQLRIGQ